MSREEVLMTVVPQSPTSATIPGPAASSIAAPIGILPVASAPGNWNTTAQAFETAASQSAAAAATLWQAAATFAIDAPAYSFSASPDQMQRLMDRIDMLEAKIEALANDNQQLKAKVEALEKAMEEHF